jgi:hypothetical protein
MPSPFPGMDPYLESSELWRDLHHSFIFCSRETLPPLLPPRYYGLVEERVVLEEPSRSYYPDMTVAREAAGTPTDGGVQSAQGGGVAVAAEIVADEAILFASV